MFNRLQDANGGPKSIQNRPEIEPIPIRTKLLILGGITLGMAAIHIAGHVDDIFFSETPVPSVESTQLVSYLQEDFDNRKDLLIELPIFAGGLMAYVGYLATSKPEEK